MQQEMCGSHQRACQLLWSQPGRRPFDLPLLSAAPRQTQEAASGMATATQAAGGLPAREGCQMASCAMSGKRAGFAQVQALPARRGDVSTAGEVGELIVPPPANVHDADYHELLQLIYRLPKCMAQGPHQVSQRSAQPSGAARGARGASRYRMIRGTTTVGVVVAFILAWYAARRSVARAARLLPVSPPRRRVRYRLITRWLPSAA